VVLPCHLPVPATVSSWWPPADPTSEAAAAWLQAIGVIVSLVFSAWVLWRQRRDRAEDREQASRQIPEKITGWVEHPKRERDPSTGLHRCWRVIGTVVNRSDTAIWDVQVRLLDQDGRPMSTPTLLKAVLAPDAEWPVWWTAGHRFKPRDPGGAEQDESPLPAPRAITDPAARLALEVTFTDSTGQRWRRDGSRIERVRSSAVLPPAPPGSSKEYSRAAERLAQTDPYDMRLGGPVAAPEHITDLWNALNEAARERFGAVYQPSTPDMAAGTQLTATHVLGILEEPTRRWAIAGGYTEQIGGVQVLAGAVNELTQHLAVGDSGGRGAEDLTAAVCSVLTVLGGLARAR
jgi:hypothetical protein